MLIAVTGATGFLGRYLVRHLSGAGHKLRCWHRPASDKSGLEDVEWLAGGLGDAASTEALVRGADAVVHAAVQWEGPRTRGRASHGAPSVFLDLNLRGSLQLFQTAFDAGAPRHVFVPTRAAHQAHLHS